MNSRELPFREIDGSSFFGAAERTGRRGAPRRRFKALAGGRHHVGFTVDPAGAGDVVPRDEGSRLCPG